MTLIPGLFRKICSAKFMRINVAKPAVFGLCREGFDIGFVHPDVPRAHTRLGAVVDHGSGIDSFRHKMLPFYEMDEDIIPQVP